ncbi:MAG: OmpA family protein [Bacteroidales bacterium]
MRFIKISFLITLLTVSITSIAQEMQSNIYTDAEGRIYVKVDSPIYFFVSPNNDSSNKTLIPSSDSLANPMFFDGPGRHYFAYENNGEKVRYLVYADAKGPRPIVKVEQGQLFAKGKRLYVDIAAKISITAKDDYSGAKSIFYAIKDSGFTPFNETITLTKEGETELKIFATDNVGNISDTSIYKIVVSPEALFKIDNIYFETASARLLPESFSNLDEMLGIMQEFPELLVEIGAHADARGSSESNMALSERRAQAVTNYLISKGIEANRLKAKGYGDTQVINECTKGVNCPDSKHKQNRRVEFKFSLPKQR